MGSYSLRPEEKYWYTTGVNNIQWRYPTASDGGWDLTPSSKWDSPRKPIEFDRWKPDMVPFTTVLEKPETLVDIESIRERLREEIFLEIRDYIDRIVPAIISMLADRWISILGKEKKYTDGVFCFNCGAPIPRGKEKETCSFCGN